MFSRISSPAYLHLAQTVRQETHLNKQACNHCCLINTTLLKCYVRSAMTQTHWLWTIARTEHIRTGPLRYEHPTLLVIGKDWFMCGSFVLVRLSGESSAFILPWHEVCRPHTTCRVIDVDLLCPISRTRFEEFSVINPSVLLQNLRHASVRCLISVLVCAVLNATGITFIPSFISSPECKIIWRFSSRESNPAFREQTLGS